MKILVTGAAGFIGSHLSERLPHAGHDVVALDSFDTFYDPAVKERNLARSRAFPGFEEVRGDIRDPQVYAGLPEDIDTVVHLAARAGVRPSIDDPQLYVDVNLGGTTLLLEFVRERGIRRLLFGSSSSVYGDAAPVPFSEDDPGGRPISPYAATKRAGELLVHALGHLFINAADATLMSRLVDGVVVVVRSRTPPRALVARLPEEVPNLMGVVVDDLKKDSMPDFGDYFAEYAVTPAEASPASHPSNRSAGGVSPVGPSNNQPGGG